MVRTRLADRPGPPLIRLNRRRSIRSRTHRLGLEPGRCTGCQVKRQSNTLSYREKRKAGPAVWVFSYRDGQTNRKEQIGTVEHFPTKSAAQKACESLHKHINNGNLRPRTLADLIADYTLKNCRKEVRKPIQRGRCTVPISTWTLPHRTDMHSRRCAPSK